MDTSSPINFPARRISRAASMQRNAHRSNSDAESEYLNTKEISTQSTDSVKKNKSVLQGQLRDSNKESWERNMHSSFVPKILSRIIKHSWATGRASIGHVSPGSIFMSGFILLVDISGFTKLSARYCDSGKDGIDDLQQATNGFMSDIVEMIYSCGGDIVKYAGDAILSIFPVDDDNKDIENNDGDNANTSMKQLSTLQAVICAYQLKSMVSTENLTVHVALSAGDICCAILGGSHERWECLISGSCLTELSQCLDDASSGDATLSKSAVRYIGQQTVDRYIELEALPSGNFLLTSCASLLQRDAPTASLQMHDSLYGCGLIAPASTRDDLDLRGLCDGDGDCGGGLITHSGDGVAALSTAANDDRVAGATTTATATSEFHDIDRLLPMFCPAPVGDGLLNGDLDNIAEIRHVTVVFLKFESYSTEKHYDLLSLQPAFLSCQDIVYKASGYIRQFIIDDKGCVLIACWGVPSASFIDNSSRAVSSCVEMHCALNKMGMECSFGVTTGNAYCGCVGSERRREYAAIGDIVNLSARLMGKARGSIFVDQATYDAVPHMSQKFRMLEPIVVKGKVDPIQAFSYDFDVSREEKGSDKLVSLAKIMLTNENWKGLEMALADIVGDSVQHSHERSLKYLMFTGRDSANKVLLDYLFHSVAAANPLACISVVRVCIETRDAFFQLRVIARIVSGMAYEFLVSSDRGNVNLAIGRIVEAVAQSSGGSIEENIKFISFLLIDVLGIDYIPRRGGGGGDGGGGGGGYNDDVAIHSSSVAQVEDTIFTPKPTSEQKNISLKKLWYGLRPLFKYMLCSKKWLISLENIDLVDSVSLFFLYTLSDIACTSTFVLTTSVDTEKGIREDSKNPVLLANKTAISSWAKWQNALHYFRGEDEVSTNIVVTPRSSLNSGSRTSGNDHLSSGSISQQDFIAKSVAKFEAANKRVWAAKFSSVFVSLPNTVHLLIEDMDKQMITQSVVRNFPSLSDESRSDFVDMALKMTNGEPYWVAELLDFVGHFGVENFIETLHVAEVSTYFIKSGASGTVENNGDDSSSVATRGRNNRRAVTLESFKTRDVVIEGGSVTDNSILEAFLVCKYEALTPDAQLVLRLMSIIGYRFQYSTVMSIVSSRIAVHLDEIVDTLVSSRWITATISSSMLEAEEAATTTHESLTHIWYCFQHPLFQQVLYNFTPVSARMDLHSNIADKLKHQIDLSFEQYAEIFKHLKSCDRCPEAIEYAVLAGNLAIDGQFDVSVGVDYCLELIRKSMKLCSEVSEVDRLVGLVTSAIFVLRVSAAQDIGKSKGWETRGSSSTTATKDTSTVSSCCQNKNESVSNKDKRREETQAEGVRGDDNGRQIATAPLRLYGGWRIADESSITENTLSLVGGRQEMGSGKSVSTSSWSAKMRIRKVEPSTAPFGDTETTYASSHGASRPVSIQVTGPVEFKSDKNSSSNNSNGTIVKSSGRRCWTRFLCIGGDANEVDKNKNKKSNNDSSISAQHIDGSAASSDSSISDSSSSSSRAAEAVASFRAGRSRRKAMEARRRRNRAALCNSYDVNVISAIYKEFEDLLVSLKLLRVSIEEAAAGPIPSLSITPLVTKAGPSPGTLELTMAAAAPLSQVSPVASV